MSETTPSTPVSADVVPRVAILGAGGRMGRHAVPAVREAAGLELVAERATGRRNKIGSVIVSRIDADTDDRGVDAATQLASGREARAS